jgi:DNA-binding GntR family transcriptional regulator
MGNSKTSSEQSKAERVYQDLRRKIRELSLPPGFPLRKEDIAASLGVSRAPVSEAISRLADEALVDIYPQHGSFVSPIRSSDVRESLFIRTALEVEAARRVAQQADEALIETLDENLQQQEAALKSGDLPAFYDLDEALHSLIFEAIESPRALRLLDAARAPLDRPRRITLPEEGRAAGTYAEHKRLVEAIRTRDPEFAAAAMRTHLTQVAQAVERELAEIEKAEEEKS